MPLEKHPMTLDLLFEKAVQAINTKGFLLLFPINNSTTPDSLWYNLFPKTKMRWEWDESADNRVVQLWHLSRLLAQSKDVVYGKYYQGRATFFSKDVFSDLLALRGTAQYQSPNPESRKILELLEMDSPLSTKQLKEFAELKGKMLEPIYTKAVRDLWENLAIVGLGEIEDGAFPSLAHAASRTAFEELVLESKNVDIADAWIRLCDLPDFDSLERNLLRPKDWRTPLAR